MFKVDKHVDGKWYVWTWVGKAETEEHGPYETEEKAREVAQLWNAMAYGDFS